MTTAEFLQGPDFMRLGQAINHSSWQSAMMIIRRMSEVATELGLEDIAKKLSQVKICVQSRNKQQALSAMTLLTAVRVKKLNDLHAKEAE